MMQDRRCREEEEEEEEEHGQARTGTDRHGQTRIGIWKEEKE